MKILAIIGARPQFVKAAVVSRAIVVQNGRGGERIDEVLVHTGQHYNDNMSAIFFCEREIPECNYNLGICDGSHGGMNGRMFKQIEPALLRVRPEVVLDCGDTRSTPAGALAAVKQYIPAAHVEAELRFFDINTSWEINLILTDRISEFLFCPTHMTSTTNLRRVCCVNGAERNPASAERKIDVFIIAGAKIIEAVYCGAFVAAGGYA